MTTSTLPPSPAAALHLLRGIGVLSPNEGLARTPEEWEELAFLHLGANRRCVLLARSLCTTGGTRVAIGQILNEVALATEASNPMRPPAWVVLEALAIAAGMPVWGAQIAASARQYPTALPRWVLDGWTPLQAATTLIARRALGNAETYRAEIGRRYDWWYAAQSERFVDAAALGDALESDGPLVDMGKILRTNAGWFNGTYLAAFTLAAGIITDSYVNGRALRALNEAAEHDGLTPAYAC